MKITKELTARQKRVLKFIVESQEEMGITPTLEEIRDRFGWKAVGTVQDHVRALSRKGYLGKGGGARALRVLRDPDLPGEEEDGIWSPSWEERRRAAARVSLVPLVGEVAAGSPILAVENVEEEWFLDQKLLKGKDNFLVRVRGDSMTDAQIRDGDYVLVRPQSDVESGEIVVARLGEEVTVKRFFRGKDRIELLPANPRYAPLVFRKGEGEVEIVGKVIGVLRKY